MKLYGRFKVIFLWILQLGLLSFYAHEGYAAGQEAYESEMPAAQPTRIAIASETTLEASGLKVQWCAPIYTKIPKINETIFRIWQPQVHDVLSWRNKINKVHQELKQFYKCKRLADRYEFVVTSGEKELNLPMTASDAMARYHLKDQYVEGDDAGNRAKLIASMKAASTHTYMGVNPLQASEEEAMDTLLARHMQREREHQDQLVLYHGTSGEVGFLYTIYQALYHLVAPIDERAFRLRAFDSRFFSIMNIEEILAQRVADNDHLLCTNTHALHDFSEPDSNAFFFCIRSLTLIPQNFSKRLSGLFQGVGIALTEEHLSQFLSLYEKYFLTSISAEGRKHFRGFLLQLFLSPERFAQNVRLSWGGMSTCFDLSDSLKSPCSDAPEIQFMKELRKGNTTELTHITEELPFGKPLEFHQARMSLDPVALNDSDTKAFMEYYPPLLSGEQKTFLAELEVLVETVVQSNPIKGPERLWYPFRHQYLALKHHLRNHANVLIQTPALKDDEILGFLHEASPAEIVEYIEEHPEFLDHKIKVPAKVFNIEAPKASVRTQTDTIANFLNPETILELPVREIILRFQFSGEGFSEKFEATEGTNIMKAFKLLAKRGSLNGFDLADPRLSRLALKMPKLQEALIQSDVWGAKPVRVSDETGCFVFTYPSLLDVPELWQDWDNLQQLFNAKDVTALEKLLSTNEFKEYALTLTPHLILDINHGAMGIINFLFSTFTKLGWTLDEMRHLFENILYAGYKLYNPERYIAPLLEEPLDGKAFERHLVSLGLR